MLTWGLLIGLGVLLVLLLARGSKKREVAAAPSRHPVDVWIEEALARELGRELAIDAAALQRSLEGEPDPDTVAAVEDAVRSVEVRFSRLPLEGQFEVHMNANLERGGSVTATKRLVASELPGSVGDDFVRTGAAMVFRAWDFPWSSSRPGW